MRITSFIIPFIFILQSVSYAQEIPNSDFEQGKKETPHFQPAHWSNPNGMVFTPGYESKHALAVKGNGENDAAWHSQAVKVQPAGLYEFSFWSKSLPDTQGGLATSGPLFVNRDFRPTDEWKRYAFVFRVPDDEEEAIFRVGQWNVDGTLVYDNVGLTPVQPIYKKQDSITLGQGEKIDGNSYNAEHNMSAEGSNSCRFLKSTTARFNSNRWLMVKGSEVIYHHELPQRSFTKGDVFINLNHHTGGYCRILLRTDKIDWTEVGTLNEVSSQTMEIPEKALPATFVETKLVGMAKPEGNCNFQINQYHFDAQCDKESLPFQGRTEYARVIESNEKVSVELVDIGNPKPKQTTHMKISLKNESEKPINLKIDIDEKKQTVRSSTVRKRVEARGKATIPIPYTIQRSGETTLLLIAQAKQDVLYECEIPISISYLYDADYGAAISRDDRSDIWWCPATYKIAQSRPAPSRGNKAVQFSAARGEFEPVQIVLRPKEDLKDVEVSIDDFKGSHGTVLNAKHFSVKQVEYVKVEHPSDEWGTPGLWPDPLPPVNQPMVLSADRNWPFWITVKVPQDAKAGMYKGSVRFHNESWEKKVPVQLKVYDFEIPETFNLRTAFGFSVGNVKRYHNLDSEEDVKKVVDLYFQNFRDHRISPYNPMQMYPIKAEIQNEQFVFDFDEFKKAARRYINEFGFNSIRLPLVGMGGGTFHSRRKGRIGGHVAGTEEHERLFGQYASTIEQFLKENRWLDETYIYWFDEPTPKDYDFVREGMERIDRHAPGLQRMLTEQPEEELFGYVDIWCPVLHHYDELAAHARQEKDEHIWWYVCTGPKQPYPGLFTDHPAVDMRIWLWMTHKYDVEGCLVWQTNYWSSSAAYPDTLQNPWDDPMSYQSGYGRPAGYIGYWGNGDGRFIYPPKNWNSGEKIISGPVDSIRWEMLREGIEDYEYFYAIRQALEEGNLNKRQKEKAEELLAIPESIIQSRTEYSKDPKPMYDYREKLAKFLEDIQ